MRLLRVASAFIRAAHTQSASHGAATACSKLVDKYASLPICPAQRLFSPIPPTWTPHGWEMLLDHKCEQHDSHSQQRKRRQPQPSFMAFPKELIEDIEDDVLLELEAEADKLQAARTKRGTPMSEEELQRLKDPVNVLELNYLTCLEACNSCQLSKQQFEKAQADCPQGSADIENLQQAYLKAQKNADEACFEYEDMLAVVEKYYRAAALEVYQIRSHNSSWPVRYR